MRHLNVFITSNLHNYFNLHVCLSCRRRWLRRRWRHHVQLSSFQFLQAYEKVPLIEVYSLPTLKQDDQRMNCGMLYPECTQTDREMVISDLTWASTVLAPLVFLNLHIHLVHLHNYFNLHVRLYFRRCRRCRSRRRRRRPHLEIFLGS